MTASMHTVSAEARDRRAFDGADGDDTAKPDCSRGRVLSLLGTATTSTELSLGDVRHRCTNEWPRQCISAKCRRTAHVCSPRNSSQQRLRKSLKSIHVLVF